MAGERSLSKVARADMSSVGIANATVVDGVLDVVGNWTNDTVADASGTPLIKKVHDGMIVAILVTIMFAMGCHIKLLELWNHLKRPFGILVGMFCQFIMMPLIAFGLLSVMKLSGLYAIGMLIVACCPGGTVSNIFAYFCDGDVPLSIAMTLCSTILAMGMMPLNMLFYGQYINTGNIVVPHSKMAMSLVVVSLPAAFGMLFNWYFPRIAPYVTKYGSTAGGVLILISQILEVFIFPDIFKHVPASLYGATVLMPMMGMMVGYVVSWVFRRPEPVRKTVAIESGIQNVGTALTIVSLSFKFDEQKEALVFAWLYALTMIALSFSMCVVYNVHKKYCSRSQSHDLADSCSTVQPTTQISKDNEKSKLARQDITSHGVFNPAFSNQHI